MGHSLTHANEEQIDSYGGQWLRNNDPGDGRIKVERELNELLIDLDEPYVEFIASEWESTKLKRLIQAARLKVLHYEYWPSAKSGNTHIRVTIGKQIDDKTACLYQMALGSDPFREVMAYSRVENDIYPAILFFERQSFIDNRVKVIL